MASESRLNLFRDYAQRQWGGSVGKILLSTGVPCPNRDRGGCVYCAAESYRPYYFEPTDSLVQQLRKGKDYLRRIRARHYFGCFQMETSTAGEWNMLREQYCLPMQDPDCVGLVISTRPDAFDDAFLEQLNVLAAGFPSKTVIIELGLQSAWAESLRWLNRNHTPEDFRQAVARLRSHGRFEIGAHLILGIPDETRAQMRDSVIWACASGLHHLKLHHLQVVKGTPLSERYRTRPFSLPTAEDYLDWLCDLIPWIPRSIVLHRLWSTCRPGLLEAPRWLKDPGQLYAGLFARLEQRNLQQGQYPSDPNPQRSCAL